MFPRGATLRSLSDRTLLLRLPDPGLLADTPCNCASRRLTGGGVAAPNVSPTVLDVQAAHYGRCPYKFSSVKRV